MLTQNADSICLTLKIISTRKIMFMLYKTKLKVRAVLIIITIQFHFDLTLRISHTFTLLSDTFTARKDGFGRNQNNANVVVT